MQKPILSLLEQKVKVNVKAKKFGKLVILPELPEDLQYC